MARKSHELAEPAFDEQCALMKRVGALANISKSKNPNWVSGKPGTNFFTCIEDNEDPSEIITKLLGRAELQQFSDISVAEYSSITPVIKLYKVLDIDKIANNSKKVAGLPGTGGFASLHQSMFYSGRPGLKNIINKASADGKKSYDQPINIGGTASRDNILGMVRRGDGQGVGLTDLSFDFKHQNLAMQERFVDVSMKFLFHSPNLLVDEDEDGFSYSDLFIQPGHKQDIYNHNHYQLKLVVGYGTAGLKNKKLKKEIDRMTTTMFLTLRDYDLNFLSEGQLELTLNYASFIETAVASNDFNIFGTKFTQMIKEQKERIDKKAIKSIESKMRDLSEQRDALNANLNILGRKLRKVTYKWDGQDVPLVEDTHRGAKGRTALGFLKDTSGLEQLKKEYATYKQQQGDVTALEQRRQFTIMNNMDDIQKMIDIHDQLGSLSAAGEKLQGDLAAVSSITSVIATKEKIKAFNNIWEKIDEKVFRVSVAVQAVSPRQVVVAESRGTFFRGAYDRALAEARGKKKVLDQDTIQKALDTAFDQTFPLIASEKNIHFIYLGDLINAMLGPYENSPGLSEAFKAHQFRLLLGPVVYENPKKAGQFIRFNMADIPISYRLLSLWFHENILKKAHHDLISVAHVLKNMVQSLITSALSPKCGFQKKDKVQVQIAHFSAPGIGSGPNSRDRLDKKVRITANEIQGLAVSDNFNSTENMYHYMVMYVSNSGNDYLNSDYKKDLQKGIYHFQFAADRGILVDVKFKKMSIKYLQEARMMKAATSGEDPIFSVWHPYNAQLTLKGNTLLKPGMMIFIHPGKKLGHPADSSSAARKLGLGGYYYVTKVSNTIKTAATAASWDTEVDCIFHSQGQSNKLAAAYTPATHSTAGASTPGSPPPARANLTDELIKQMTNRNRSAFGLGTNFPHRNISEDRNLDKQFPDRTTGEMGKMSPAPFSMTNYLQDEDDVIAKTLQLATHPSDPCARTSLRISAGEQSVFLTAPDGSTIPNPAVQKCMTDTEYDVKFKDDITYDENTTLEDIANMSPNMKKMNKIYGMGQTSVDDAYLKHIDDALAKKEISAEAAARAKHQWYADKNKSQSVGQTTSPNEPAPDSTPNDSLKASPSSGLNPQSPVITARPIYKSAEEIENDVKRGALTRQMAEATKRVLGFPSKYGE